MKIEIASGISLEAKAIGDDGTFEGYASVTGHKDSHGDILMPGSFTSSLKVRPIQRVKMLREHRQDSGPIGVWTAATEDSRGLHVKGRLIREVPLAAQTYALMREGALDQLSIGFRTVRESFDRKAAARLVEEVDLREISIITFGSNDRAVINVVKAAYDPGRVAAGISELTTKLEKYL